MTLVTLSVSDQLTFSAPWPEGAWQPLQQSPAYGVAMRRLGADIVRVTAADADGLVLEGLMMQRKVLGLYRLSTVLRGPLWYTNTPERRIAALKTLRAAHPRWRGKGLIITPEEAAGAPLTEDLQTAGFKRVMTGFSTVWMDLRRDTEALRAGLKGKWRNQLKKAEASKIMVNASTKAKKSDWILEKEHLQRAERRYQAIPVGLVPHFRSAGGQDSVLTVTAHLSGQPVAGALFLLSGQSATYHIGWSGEQGRAENAQNLVLWHSILDLRSRNISFLDLGGLNTAQLAGLARFKLGLGGTPITLMGSYL